MMSAENSKEPSFNSRAPEFCPKQSLNTSNRFACLDNSKQNGGRSRSSSYSTTNKARGRSQSLSIQLEARRPVLRVKVSNFSLDFNKSEFIELVNSKFSDIRSIDFQPRYNEKGRLYGFITFETELGYDECIKLKEFQFGDDLLRIEPGQDKGNIPTSTTLIVSNIPTSTTEEEYKEWLMKQDIQPLSFTFINQLTKGKKPQKQFTGCIFIQYRNIEDASIAWGYLKDEEYKGQLMKFEFKKKQDKREFENENKPVFLNDKAKQLWSQMMVFKNTFVQNKSIQIPSLIFPNDLSPFEKSIVFTYTEKLGLCHYTQGDGDEKHIIISNTPPSQAIQKAQTPSRPSRSGRSSRAGSVNDLKDELPNPAQQQQQQRRPRRASCPDLHLGPQRKPVISAQTSGTVATQRVALGPEDGLIGFSLRRSKQ